MRILPFTVLPALDSLGIWLQAEQGFSKILFWGRSVEGGLGFLHSVPAFLSSRASPFVGSLGPPPGGVAFHVPGGSGQGQFVSVGTSCLCPSGFHPRSGLVPIPLLISEHRLASSGGLLPLPPELSALWPLVASLAGTHARSYPKFPGNEAVTEREPLGWVMF